MTIEFTLSTGVKLQAEIENFDSEQFAKQLNDPQTLFVTVGDNGFSKHIITSWHRVGTQANA